MVAKEEKEKKEMDWEFGVSRCKLLHLEWINNKILIYSTGNYIQYPGINHNRKEYYKECICVYIYESSCCTAEQHNFVNQLNFS